ncbi:Major facilitator superfamily domain general substrate transporter [Penicillium cf. griseofulvum]|uniref:Major facilitator superfamily domain general substrate transporter n=1 Tax=Penicillium cf. griseofulvum TaxID=2972120 RepID=A0A9W9T5D3_9EURO|nr:Major facilitator superfamily domain general substrate transporter [Penicillium cf. griseofulvum]KAJ5421280.1 Major facilitator superfamily domain general substrate transporter [Penicillium cf. griseofulvum]KAJ5424516.1 Major facilitator superfamily domain general substrate transporter [Penicillium cf. griseofulvum]
MSTDRENETSAAPPYNEEVTQHVVLNEKTMDVDFDKENLVTPDGGEPTLSEKTSLRHVAENLPLAAWLVAVVELCERFTYYGMSGLFQNYIQRPRDGSQGRGALGMDHQGATGLTTFFQFWCYVTPIIGAIIADQYLGKYKTIVVFCFIYMVGLLILVCTSIPTALEHGSGIGGFIVAILIIGLGTGGIKSNVAPLIADQYKRKKMAISTTKKGERVVIDPALTIQRIYMIFYGCINVGSLSLLATPYMELYIDFWPAYLLCLCMFMVGTLVIILGRKHYIVRPPQGSIITDAFRAIWMMIKNRNMDAPKPSWQTEHNGASAVTWDDHFIDELKRALVACRVFAFYPIYWVVYGQFSSNFVTQAGQMEGHGIPNDLMQNFDPISIIVFIPILETCVYPVMRRMKIPFRPITRIALGFVVGSLAMMYAAIVQHLIYSAGPCYESPLCEASMIDGTAYGNKVHIAIQTPAYVFMGISEIFASVSGLEYAYTKAPPSMKSFVQAMYLLTNAFGSAIAEALTPAAFDPAIMWMFTGLACASCLCGIIFYAIFYHLNDKEDDMNALDADDYMPEAPIEAERHQSKSE